MHINKMYKLIMCSFALSFVFFGCAGNSPLLKPDQGSRFAYISKHPELPADIQQAIQDGRVIKGMTMDVVKVSMGEPDSIYYVPKNKDSSWHTEEFNESWYYKGALFKMAGPSTEVFFRNEIVVEVQNTYWYDK